MRPFSTLLVLVAALLAHGPALAQASSPASPTSPAIPKDRPLKTATRIVPPFVIDEGDAPSGFSADLWVAICDRLGVKAQWMVKDTVVDLLDTVKKSQADVGIAAISITSDRDRDFDFSQPIFDSGLQILVRQTGEKTGGGAATNFLAIFYQPGFMQLIGFMILMTVLFAHLAFFAERNYEGGMSISRKYIPGIFFALWWSAGALGTQVDEMPKSPWGRFIALVWMFTGIIFISYFTAALTTQLTVQQLQGAIRGPDDLPGKRVATVRGSTSAKYLKDRKVRVMEYPTITDAFQTLSRGQAEAVVYDAPVLLYYAQNEGKDQVQVVGSVFRKEDYGIVFRTNSPYRKPINTALLSLKEDGTYDRIYDRWFGERE